MGFKFLLPQFLALGFYELLLKCSNTFIFFTDQNYDEWAYTYYIKPNINILIDESSLEFHLHTQLQKTVKPKRNTRDLDTTSDIRGNST